MKPYPRPVVVNILTCSLIFAFILSTILVIQFGPWIVGVLTCIFGYFILYKGVDHTYGWYLKGEAANTESAKKEPLIAEIPTCPKCLSIFKSRSFHEPKYEAGWELCGAPLCPFETRPLRPTEQEPEEVT